MIPDGYVCPVCRVRLGGVDYEQDRPPLVAPHDVVSTRFERRNGLHYPVPVFTPCPMSGEPIPGELVEAGSSTKRVKP